MLADPLDGVAVFVETVRAGSFARAAEHLSVTRSAVGKTIARLEERLQVRLFHRSTRSLSLTEDGRLYHESCQRALDLLGAAESLLESGRKDVTGRLRVTAPVLFGRRCVAPVLLAWAARHPALELELSFSDRSMDLFADGFDLAVRMGPLKPDGALRARRLVGMRKLLCAAPAYLQRRGTPQQIDELHAHEHLVYRRGEYVQPLQFETAQGLVELVPRGRIRLDDLSAIVDAAVAGLGLAWVPTWLVHQELAAGQLVPLLTQHLSTPMEMHAVWAAHAPMPLRLRQAVDELVEALPGRVPAP
ncbi:LysR family transcriptional regulator [Aquincola tertiaricarbonis]|uniref:LysR family transcriptional regulator n=1 Tax=Aquincola tertiaricarbonis TaxID=391953 RepID=A0ABY4S471_AQUTE|nr:LysR family transcriptional regulator [Aquincola tertiaricarbonis]URI07239.1 LysR family transcriptional regulator [Aquincola tertiaricarbonis]